ncbi:MAG TPA: nitroreductase/quinone reductase family protein [Jiangellales bacterium]|nr:nitroreductase/quinone reductase family protein [Jiangellales bacterium]
MSRLTGWLFAAKRTLYGGDQHRPGALMRALNRLDVLLYGSGRLSPRHTAVLEVVGRRSGRTISVPIAIADVGRRRYLVSMLGEDAGWVRNVRAAGGRAVLRRGGRTEVTLTEVPVAERAPVLRRYLAIAPGARPHFPVARHAPLAQFEQIAHRYPVFRIQEP